MVQFFSGLFPWRPKCRSLFICCRRQREVISWGAMQFLAPEIIHQRRMKRIDDLLLMILRTLAILGVILAMAQPMLSSGLFGFGSIKEEVILVLDVSLSTDLKRENRVLFDELRDAVLVRVDEIENGTPVRLLLAGEHSEWLYPTSIELSAESRTRIREDLNKLQPTLAEADLGKALLQVLDSKPDQNVYLRQIILFTDGFKAGWEVDSNSLWNKVKQQQELATVPTSIQIWTPILNANSKYENISIEEIRSLRTHVSLNDPVKLTAVVKNRGSSSIQNISLEWTANGQNLGLSSISQLEPGKTAEIDFDYAAIELGVVKIECTTPIQDDLKLDNRSERLLSVVERIPLLVVSRAEELNPPQRGTQLVLSALGQSPLAREINQWKSVFEPKLISWEDLEGENLDPFACLLLLDVPAVSEAVVQNLTRFVRNGGGLWIVAGTETNSDSFNASFHRGGAGLSPLPLGGLRSDEPQDQPYTVLIPPERDHPALHLIGDLERLDLHEVRITEHFQLSVPDQYPSNRVWLESAEGNPLVVENYLGRGRVIVQALPFDLEWSNLPICRLFVALVQEWLLHLSQPSAAQLNLEPGETFRFHTSLALNSDSLKIKTPLLHEKRPALLKQEGESQIIFAETNWPGAYQVSWSNEDETNTNIPFYVSRNQDESTLTQLNPEERAHLAEQGGLYFGDQPVSDISRYEQVETPKTPFWTQLLMLALVCFAAEMLLTLFIARRRYAGSLFVD
ncbi:MAG: BatA domain-containing protein [Planctomycetaceae bacterium]